MSAKVAVVMGSRSDEEVMSGCGELLDRFGIEYEQHVMSAHRTPDRVADFMRAAASSRFVISLFTSFCISRASWKSARSSIL